MQPSVFDVKPHEACIALFYLCIAGTRFSHESLLVRQNDTSRPGENDNRDAGGNEPDEMIPCPERGDRISCNAHVLDGIIAMMSANTS
jgi:hypothetical protein